MTEGKWYPIFIYSEKNKVAHNTIMHSKQIVITVALSIANVCEVNYIHSNYNDIHYCTNWASEASPTLGCSIEISLDILYRYVSYVKLTA